VLLEDEDEVDEEAMGNLPEVASKNLALLEVELGLGYCVMPLGTPVDEVVLVVVPLLEETPPPMLLLLCLSVFM